MLDHKKIEVWVDTILKNWPLNKSQVPASLHETFDLWHGKYIQQGNIITISEQETQIIAQALISSLLLESEKQTLEAQITQA